MSCDPQWADVVLFVDGNSTNGSTTFVDQSPVGNIMTAVGSPPAAATNANQLFGQNTINTQGGGGAITCPITFGSPLDLSTYNATGWTIEFWVYYEGSFDFPFELGSLTTGTNGIACEHSNATETQFIVYGTTGTSSINNTQGMALNTWNHIAIQADNLGNLQSFVNGYAGFNPANFAGLAAIDGLVVVGGFYNAGNPDPDWNGQLANFRVTGGYVRYPFATTGTLAFTPPAAPFPIGSCTITVPDVVGEDLTTAEAAIISANLTVGTVTAVSSVEPVNQVLSQNPVGGTSESAGSPVNLNYSQGVIVPDVTNTSAAVVAPGILAAAGFVVGAVTYDTSGIVIAGNVISQSPTGGTYATAGSAINLTVSTGLPALTVPDLFGLTQQDAINLLLSLGLVPGAIGSAPSQFVPPNLVQTQNPSAGAPVAVGTIVSFVLSLGIPAVGEMFDFEQTVISQYANSPTIMQLCANLNQYIDQSANFANFFNYVWNVDTAVGFGLDIWGKIVNVSRLLQIPNSTPYVGFYISSESQPDQDWTPAGSDQDNPPVGGAFYTGYNATEAYLLDDASYRQLILAKAFANICTTTAPAINQILQNLYGPGTAWVLNEGPMAISYNLSFTPTAIQLAILEQSGVIPTPPGVSVVINTNV
jgi:beta-lactam-binding protein with PASTA domain